MNAHATSGARTQGRGGDDMGPYDTEELEDEAERPSFVSREAAAARHPAGAATAVPTAATAPAPELARQPEAKQGPSVDELAFHVGVLASQIGRLTEAIARLSERIVTASALNPSAETSAPEQREPKPLAAVPDVPGEVVAAGNAALRDPFAEALEWPSEAEVAQFSSYQRRDRAE